MYYVVPLRAYDFGPTRLQELAPVRSLVVFLQRWYVCTLASPWVWLGNVGTVFGGMSFPLFCVFGPVLGGVLARFEVLEQLSPRLGTDLWGSVAVLVRTGMFH